MTEVPGGGYRVRVSMPPIEDAAMGLISKIFLITHNSQPL